jgi:sarcosine oxidase subunit beta
VKRAATVVVIGAGVVGASIAFHLAREGVRDVIVLDRGRFGSGSTAKGAGGLRSQFDDPAEIAFSRFSIEFYRRFPETVGAECEFDPCGFLFLLRDDAAATRCAQMATRGRAAGIDWRLLRQDEIAALAPALDVGGVIGGSYTPNDGTANPPRAAHALLERAQALGVVAEAETGVTGFRFAGQRLEAVETSRGAIATRCAVIAAGPWAAEVGQLAGIALPVTPMRRQLFTTAALATPLRAPMTIDQASGWYFRVETDHLLVSAGELAPVSEFDPTVDPRLAEPARAGLRRVLPALSEIPFVAARAGLREMTPDEKAILGWAPNREGLLIAAGFSGHGFMHAPAAGQAIADLVVRGATQFDLAPFDPARFTKKD